MTRIIISGAGIGGLTLAIACLQRGLDVVLLEKATALKEVGAGIQIPPNAVKVLHKLDLFGAVSEYAFRPHSIEARMGMSGRPVFDIPLSEAAVKRWGAPYLHIHRARYVEALATKLPEDRLRLHSELSYYAIHDEGVRVTLSSGETLEGDILIGADGIKSTVRAQMMGQSQPRFTGSIAWRAVIPVECLGAFTPRPTACAWFGRGKHAVTYRLGAKGEHANFVGVVERDDWQEEGWSIEGSKAEALADFDGWHPTITTLIENADTLNRWALFDRNALAKWVQGPVALLGDAAHPMLPFLAQGAAMAVEDAWVLSEVLSKNASAQGLENYQTKRLARTARVQAASRANMTTFHKRTIPEQLATYGPMWLAGRMAPIIVHRRMDWLYGHDVTRSE